jgi:hypothetical protein
LASRIIYQPVGIRRRKWSSALFHNGHKLRAAKLMAAVESRGLAPLKISRVFFLQHEIRIIEPRYIPVKAEIAEMGKNTDMLAGQQRT